MTFGATYLGNRSWNFSLFATQEVTHLVLADYTTQKEFLSIPLFEEQHKIGNVWSLRLEDLPQRFFYTWKRDDTYLVDPFARLLYTGSTWGDNRWDKNNHFFAVATEPVPYLWKAKAPTIDDPIIYEMHVRGMTKELSNGTWTALSSSLDHLASLGVNTLELLPIYEFHENEWPRINPKTKEPLYNYWGYSPMHFFSPMQRYASHEDPIQASLELKEFIDTCHEKGFQVVLDVVYNHTGNSCSLQDIAKNTYYILDDQGEHTNFSGCGNTLNTNHPVTQQLILESLRHWVLEYHIDGFRFDLASTFLRGLQGEELSFSPILQAISSDPVLASKIRILEPWDAGGIYKTGSLFRNEVDFPLYEWNDRFRDDVRRFIRGDMYQKGLFASRLSGSEDIYRNPSRTTRAVNYITCHDGFTLHDLVSYNEKHNLANGEDNRDGSNENCSWNCGKEGPTHKKSIQQLRSQQMKNFLLALTMSKGAIMIHQGDEYGHTKNGNNNSWCHDTDMNWYQWQRPIDPFLAACLALRKKSSTLSKKEFFTDKDVDWHGLLPFTPEWDSEEKFLGVVTKKEGKPEYYIGFAPKEESSLVTLPSYPGGSWHLILWTSHKPAITSFQKIEVPSFSSFLLEWK